MLVLNKATPINHADILRDEALLDFQRALDNLCNARILSAYLYLRMYLEKYISYIDFSTNESNYLLWKIGDKDINWSNICSADSGIFSSSLSRAYASGLDEHRLQYLKIAQLAYRECSEFVHGGFINISTLSSEIKFDKEASSRFMDRAESINTVIFFCWCLRYISAPNCDIASISEIILDRLGKISPLRVKFEVMKSND